MKAQRMNDTPIVLSISLLISGREEMKKSLDSLHYFTEAFPCEIILVDTGCNPEQRALAEEYADKIIDFEWCGDFAAARNAGLKEARGEWFLYLDDDEWFDNPQEIVNFFVSGEYKDYKCASYAVRNYNDLEGTMYEDSYPSRMIKLEPETRFTGKVHEFMEPFGLPKKIFTDFAHHYGYAYKNEEEQRQHAYRNIAPLLELRKEQWGDPRWMCQLVQEYFSIHEYDNTFRVARESLEEWAEASKKEIVYAPCHIGALYAYILIALENLKRYEEEEKWLDKAFADRNMTFDYMKPTLAFYCLAGARLYKYLKDYKKSREYFARYISYFRRLKGDRDILEAGSTLMVSSVFQETFLYGTVLLCMESAIRMEDHALAEEAFYLLDWQDWRLQNQLEHEKTMLDAMCNVPWHPVWRKILQTLVARPQGMKEMLIVFLETEIEYKHQGDAGREKLTRLHRLAAGLDYEHRYMRYSRILWAEKDPEIPSKEERRQKIEGLFDELVEKHQEEILEIKAEIWSVAMRQGISLESLLQQVDYRSWRQKLERWCREAELWEIRQWDDLLMSWAERTDWKKGDGEKHPLRTLLLAVKCKEGLLLRHREADMDLKQMEQTLWQYADNVLTMQQPYFKEFVFEQMPEALPDEVQLALQLKEQQRCREEGDDLKILESVRKCLGICPGMEAVIDTFAKMVRDEMQRRDREADEAQGELRRVIAALKKAARVQMANGGCREARDILLQVQQCAPDDSEVKELLEKLDEV